MAPFRWPLPLNDMMPATEVAVRKPTCATEWDVIASILSTVFSTNERKVVLTGLQREARPSSEQIGSLKCYYDEIFFFFSQPFFSKM